VGNKLDSYIFPCSFVLRILHSNGALNVLLRKPQASDQGYLEGSGKHSWTGQETHSVLLPVSLFTGKLLFLIKKWKQAGTVGIPRPMHKRIVALNLGKNLNIRSALKVGRRE
jgi:hypothetical protein